MHLTINGPLRKEHDVITHWKCHVRGHAKLEVKEKNSQFLIKAKYYVTDGNVGPLK